MPKDPLLQYAQDALQDLARRYTKLGLALTAAAEGLPSGIDEPEPSEEFGQQREPASINPAVPDAVQSFHSRLAQVYGVIRVTVAEAGPERYRFLVEMAAPDRDPPAGDVYGR